MVKQGAKLIFEFLEKYNLEPESFNGYMLTTGPGSFTGLKVAYNILQTFSLLYPVDVVYAISTFDLVHTKKTEYVALPFGKNKSYLKSYRIPFNKKFKVVPMDEITSLSEKHTIDIGYANFSQEELEYKIKNKKFKKYSSLDDIKLLFPK
jgi:tRNA A37 threonylcarbamoyladenosine modification protein TsaB